MTQFVFLSVSGRQPITPVQPVELGSPTGKKSRLEDRAAQYANHNGDPRSFRMSQQRNRPQVSNDNWLEVDSTEDEEDEDNEPSPQILPFPEEARIAASHTMRITRSDIRIDDDARPSPPWAHQPVAQNQEEAAMQSRSRSYGIPSNMDPMRGPVRTARVAQSNPMEPLMVSLDNELLDRMRGAAEQAPQPAPQTTIRSVPGLADLAATVWSDATTPEMRSGMLRQYTQMLRARGDA